MFAKRNWGPTKAFALALLASSAAGSAVAQDWTSVGASGRPSWVPETVERRLHLLPALPGIKDILGAKANAYFGQHGPGMSVGLVLDDDLGLFYSDGFGYSDAARTHTPDEYTVYRAGSFSKVITGTALLTLINDPANKMSLTDWADDQRYLPELKFVCPDFDVACARGGQSLGIQLRHLVSHTSGLPDVMEQTNAAVCPWLSDLKKTWVLFPPAASAAYSGVAVEGVGLIEQRISKKPYVTFVKDNVFTPLGMHRSSMDQTTLPQSWLAQKWSVSVTTAGWSFATSPLLIPGDTAPVPSATCEPNDQSDLILTAGGYATDIVDHSAFIRTWLQKDKVTDEHPFLSPALMDEATSSLFPAAPGPLPAPCADAIALGKKNNTPPSIGDSNGFGFSLCQPANSFGVNWAIIAPGFVTHNGSEGTSGSQTGLNFNAHMGATGLISTDPYPGAGDTHAPKALDTGFMDDVVLNTILTPAEHADQAATGWSGHALPVGVARVLYLSGKTPEESDLAAFTPSFLASNLLSSTNIVAFLKKWQTSLGECSQFRVRSVNNANEITVRFYCSKQSWDAVLDVASAAPFQISWLALSAEDQPTPQQKCLSGCSINEETCMGGAHASSQRQLCIKQSATCTATCK
jgi:CubicO group peptidase (beta-lactamase class C family)